MFHYGIISTATITERYIKGIRESIEGEVSAIASRTLENAKKAAKKYNIPTYYGSYEELYQDDYIDIIYIPVMNSLHYECAKQALLHGKHVVVEKPFVLHSSEAIELFELAKEKHCFLMEAQKSVFLPVTQKVKELIEEGMIGKIKYIQLQAGFPSRFSYDHWEYDHDKGGGAMYGSATYTIEYLSYIFNKNNFDIDGVCVKAPTGSDDICNFTLKFDDFLVDSTIAMHVPLDNCCIFYGDLGKITVPNYWKSSTCTLEVYGKEPVTYDYPYHSEFVYEVEHIHACLQQGWITSPVMKPDLTILTAKLVEQLYDQWYKS